MRADEYVANLEMNAMTLGILSLSMKDFASEIIRHVLNGGRLDDVALTSIKATCVRYLKSIEVEGQGVPIEQEADALNSGLLLLTQMMDDAVALGKGLRN